MPDNYLTTEGVHVVDDENPPPGEDHADEEPKDREGVEAADEDERPGETVGERYVRLNPDADFRVNWSKFAPSYEGIAKSLMPKLDFGAIKRAAVSNIDTTALTRQAVPSFDNAVLARAVMPAWGNTNAFNSFGARALKASGLGEQTERTVAKLLPDLDELVRAQFQNVYLKAFEGLNEAFKRLRPRNLRDTDGLDYELISTVMTDDGIPFFLVPDGDTVVELLAAHDAATRRTVLDARADPIFNACEDILQLCVSGSLPFHGAALREAIAAYRAGFHRPAQAMAANVLDSTAREYEAATHRRYVVGAQTLAGGIKGTAYIEALDDWRLWFALSPLVKAHDADHRTDSPKTTFTRNGTAHRVTAQQYTRANAVHAIMLATSILGYAEGLW